MHSRDVLTSIMSVHYLISRHGNQMLRELHVGGGHSNFELFNPWPLHYPIMELCS